MKVLIVSNVVPDLKQASWQYISSLVKVFEKFTEVYFWFSTTDNQFQDELLGSVRYDINIEQKSKIELRLLSIVKNVYIAHGYHKRHINSLKKIVKSFKPDIVLFTSLSSGSYLFDLKKIYPMCKTILVQHNAEFLSIKENSMCARNYLKKFYYSVQKNSVLKFEKKVMRSVDYIISISESDRQFFVSKYHINPEKIYTIMPTFKYSMNFYGERLPDDTQVLSFIGAFGWYPNVKAVDYLVNYIMPSLTKNFPDVKVYLVGREPTREVYRLSKKYPKNIAVIGTVKNVSDYYKKSHCIVIPVFHGPGIKLKVLEAMASGVPTVMSSYVAKDYNIPKSEFCVADNSEEFVKYISKILLDKKFAAELSKKQVEWYINYLEAQNKNAESIVKEIVSEISLYLEN